MNSYPSDYGMFVREHGGPPVREGTAMLLSDGARIDSGPAFVPPPAEPYERDRAVKRYWRVLAEMAEQDAHHLDCALYHGAVEWHFPISTDWRRDHYGEPVADGEAILKRIRGVATRARAKCGPRPVPTL
jgi:hypothetical protein